MQAVKDLHPIFRARRLREWVNLDGRSRGLESALAAEIRENTGFNGVLKFLFCQRAIAIGISQSKLFLVDFRLGCFHLVHTEHFVVIRVCVRHGKARACKGECGFEVHE